LESNEHADKPASPLPGRRRRSTQGESRPAAAVIARLIPFQLPENLKPARNRLKDIATRDRSEDVREYAWAGLAVADGSFDTVWKEASEDASNLADLLAGIPSLQDPTFRAVAYDRVKPLIDSDAMPVGGTENVTMIQQAATRALVSMNHEPATVFASLVNLMKRQLKANRDEVPITARGLRVIPRPQWPRTEAGEAAKTLVNWAKGVPAGDRTSPSYSETVQVAQDLAGLMPATEATSLREELRKLRVSSFVIRSVREQMRYDIPRLVVEAGKPFQILFENDDFMPHNMLIVKPDTREKLGPIAAALKPDELDGEGRAFVPPSSDILAATKLLVSGQRETLKLTAPTTEGDHEYFCSYPGHYQVMRGWLVVTKDVEAYLQAHPESPQPVLNAAGEEGEDAPHKHAH
jgi:azurin